MRKVDMVAAIGLLVFVVLMVFIVIPAETTDGVWHGLSPYFYPMVMLAGIALASVGLLVQALTSPDSYTDQAEAPLTWPDLGFFSIAFAIILASTLALHWFGTWIGGFVMIAGLMLFMGELNPVRIAVVAVASLVINYGLVTWALKIPLP